MRWPFVTLFLAQLAFGQATVAQVPTQMDPTPRRSTGFAVDATGSYWAFGGFIGGSGADSVLWRELSNGQWLALAPTGGAPAAREQHGLGVHPASQALVLFGGFGSSAAALDDTWLMTGAQWVGPFAPQTRPSIRGGMLFTYDPARDRFLSFGGISNALFGGTRNNETWSLDVSDGGVTWSRVMTTGTAPSIRNASCGAVDPLHDRLLVFGGEAGNGGNPNAETWSLDLQTLAWNNDTPTGTPPSARSYCVAGWDPVSQRLLLYGGQGTSNPLSGAFAYDPVARVWTDVTPALNVGARSDAYGATHPQGGIIFFGGRSASTTYVSQTVRFTLDAGAVDAGTPDAGMLDAGRPDAGTPDAGTLVPDAGVPDAGAGVPDAGPDAGSSTPDAGTPDAGTPDAGVADAGLSDAGLGDAGPQDADAGDDAGIGADAGVVADAGAPDEDAGASVRHDYTVGCGCTSGSAELIIVALVLLRRRLRTPRGS